MATYTFNDPLSNTQTGLPIPLINLTGTLNVNYATNPPTATGTLAIPAVLGLNAQTYNNFTVTPTTVNNVTTYTIRANSTTTVPILGTPTSNLVLTYTGQNPSSATISINTANTNISLLSATNAAICFTTGTLIRTERGEIAVEDLRVGDRAVTASGRLRPIVWIGHRDLDGGGEVLAHDHQPIRVRAGAFGPGLPARDLRLSPGHPVLVGADEDGEGGVLVPIMCLINGTTVVREAAASVTYWHVELDAHDILLAEGLAAESYLDWGDRPFFAEGSDHALHNPDFVVPGLIGRCRPVAIDGPQVEAERARLDTVFAAELAGHSAWTEAGASSWLAA